MGDVPASASGPADLLRILLHDPRPELPAPDPVPAVTPADSPEWAPVVRAHAGFVSAGNAVSASIHSRLVADWEDRQQRLKGWLTRLEAGRYRSGQMSDRDIALALIGATTATLEAISTDVHEMLATAARLRERSAQKRSVIAACHRRVSWIVGRCDERMKEVADQTGRVLDTDQAVPEDVAALAALVEASWPAGVRCDASQRAAFVISDTAVEKINVQTRRVLDLDLVTVSISVKDWLCSHQWVK